MTQRATIVLVTAAVAVSAGAAAPAEAPRLASIVVGAAPTPDEQTAAAELAEYLAKATGRTFPVTPEAKAPKDQRCIYVGHTAFAKAHGLDPAKLAPEQWVMRTVGRDLVLAGGRPRGTLYAVYRFLEDVVGVHWWNPCEQTVPRRPSLAAW